MSVVNGKAFLMVVLMLQAPVLWGSAQEILERLHSDYKAMVSAENDFRQRRERGTLSGNEAADYAAYVAALHRRVAEDCVALESWGAAIPEEIPCPGLQPQTVLPVNIDQSVERTRAETVSRLDAELLSRLGEFDQELLVEQQRVRAAAVYGRAGAPGGSGGSGESAESTGSGQEGPDSTVNVGLDAAGRQAGGQGAGPGSQQQSRAKDRSRAPVYNGDDVVARQLREAAEKESDPELKKKLWEEYRKYKEGIS